MRKVFTLFFVVLCSLSMWADDAANPQGGVLSTSLTQPLDPATDVTLTYDGTGTNFAAWTPKCFIHAWLVGEDGENLGSYSTEWVACNGDDDYNDNVAANRKMTYAEVAGKYTIDINIKSFFEVADEDLPKIARMGVIVCTQYVGGTEPNKNKTTDLFADINHTYLQPVYLHGNFAGDSWANTDVLTKNHTDGTASITLTSLPANTTYTFGMRIGCSGGCWVANGATLDSDHKSTDLDDGSGNMTFKTDGAGDYTFTYTYSENTLQVTFPDGGGTVAIDNTEVRAKAVKRIVDGQLVIEREGKRFNALGAEVK